MKSIIDSWREYQSKEIAISEAVEFLQEQGINLCGSENFAALLMKAVADPKNKEVLNGLKRAIFGAHKKYKKQKQKDNDLDRLDEGTITIVNASSHDIHDIEVVFMAGPDAEIRPQQNPAIIFDTAYDIRKDESIPIQDQFPGAPQKIEAGTSKTFPAQEGYFGFAYRFFPEELYESPGIPVDNPGVEEAFRQKRGAFSPERTGTSPEKGYILFLNPAYEAGYLPNIMPLSKGVNHKFVIQNELNDDRMLPVLNSQPSFGGRGSFEISKKE